MKTENNNGKITLNEKRIMKKELLRHNEYYDLQNLFDKLYQRSEKGYTFKYLYKDIISDENLLLAYRNIKRNRGSRTRGTNRRTIDFWERQPVEEYLAYMKVRLKYYEPQKIRRVNIPKTDGRIRPLGIPNIEDRLIQQAIKQVLEPICEAQFHKHSYGFRPNRSAEHAIAYLYKKINLDDYYYIVDIDIKGFFDNVDHSKLLKQLWTIGIHDKKVISIIGAMLKAEIEGIGVPEKGVPQGGIISPLLANVVLNELDWWLSDQWQTLETQYNYATNSIKSRALKKSSELKEFYFVRYADDFKIICKNNEIATIMFHATKQWLKERLNLDINEEKSKITNLKKSYTEYLGFRIKTKKKRQGRVVKCKLTKRAKTVIYEALKQQVKKIQHSTKTMEVYKLNRMIRGYHNYFEIATEVSNEFGIIHYKLQKCIFNRLKNILSDTGIKTTEYKNKYGKYKGKEINIANLAVYPVYGIRTRPPMLLKNNINNYTPKGRQAIHKEISSVDKDTLHYIIRNPQMNKSIEFNDNRISKYVAQKGRCAISGEPLQIENMEVHHIKPIHSGGTDEYNNLIIITYDMHKLIHATNEETIQEYLSHCKLNKTKLQKLNKYRKLVGNEEILKEKK